LILSLHFIRRLLYEWFLRSHFLLSVVALVAIWRHIASKNTVGNIFLQIGVYLWAAMAILHWAYFGFRNLALGVPFATARVTKLENALRVAITVPRPWNVKAGQYIFLSVPDAGNFSGFQSHPFKIAWWERSVDGLTISLLVKPRHGFTKNLSERGNRTYLAFVDGPYGVEHDFGEYGTVLMFATGIGIAAQMPFIEELIRGYNSCEVRTRRIVLVWQMDYECKEPQSTYSLVSNSF
jgi:predicted ferric reductase